MGQIAFHSGISTRLFKAAYRFMGGLFFGIFTPTEAGGVGAFGTLITQIGVITPPVGINVYVVRSVASDIPLSVIFKDVLPLLGALALTTLLVLFFPSIALLLPSAMQ